MKAVVKYVIAAVFVVAIIAVAAAIVLSDDDDPNHKAISSVSAYPAYLTVLGNADLDNDIDSADVSAIQKLVDSGDDYDYSDYYMYDANHDGVIDSSDVEMVRAMVSAQSSGDWSSVGSIYYVNVDLAIRSYDMTKGEKVITLIAPPLDTVLALGAKDDVVGFDNRITTGKYHSEYASTFDFDTMIDVGSCNEPSTEAITNAAKTYGSVTVVCGTIDSYGPTMETVFSGTNVQVVRIASWEYGGTLYGLMTLGFILKKVQESQDYLSWYNGIDEDVAKIVSSVSSTEKAKGAAVAYGYLDELSLLGTYSGENNCLAAQGYYDSASAYLGSAGGGHGNTVTTESISAMYQSNNLRYLALLIGTPFQIKVMDNSADAQSTAAYFESIYSKWDSRIGIETLSGLEFCVSGYSFASGVSDVLDRLIWCYWLHNDEFLSYYNCTTQKEAQDVIAGYVDHYCQTIGIDGLWSFYGAENGGAAGTYGMNLLYCGADDPRNIMYGQAGGSTDV